MNGCLICESHVKKFILAKIKSLRPGWPVTQISRDAINKIEAKVRNLIVNAAKAHPTRGKAFKEIL